MGTCRFVGVGCHSSHCLCPPHLTALSLPPVRTPVVTLVGPRIIQDSPPSRPLIICHYLCSRGGLYRLPFGSGWQGRRQQAGWLQDDTVTVPFSA